MRLIPILVVLLASIETLADEAKPGVIFKWGKPFETMSSAVDESRLILLVITNDAPFQEKTDVSAASSDQQQAEADPAITEPPLWCGPLIAKAIGRASKVRPDLKERLFLQALTAGIPSELSAGIPRNQPARAILLLCDPRYRLLAFSVGVPDSDELLTMIEDAQEVSQSMTLDPELKHRDFVRALVDRNHPRLPRLWQNTVTEVTKTLAAPFGQPLRVSDIDPSSEEIITLAEAFKPAYELDVRLRFGLHEATDRSRLTILEQHPETRGAWCHALTPFIAGVNMINHWRGIVETVWGFPPITADADINELQTWISEQLTSAPVVLLVKPSQQATLLPWPPANTGKLGQAWQRVHDEALKHPCRSVDYQQLASLIRLRQLRPIDTFQASPIRYAMLERNASTVVTIRENDPPGRFASMLNRARLKTADIEAPNL